MRIRKIDLSDRSRSGPVAQQHQIRYLPTLVLYDGTREVSRDTGSVMQFLTR